MKLSTLRQARSPRMRFRSFLVRGLVAATALLWPQSSLTQADPRPPAVRPAMPTRFDLATVQRLVDEVEKPHSATILRAGYFMRRGNTELPQSDGLALVKAAVDKEVIGTKRWFILQSLVGFASLRVPGASPQDGIAAYGVFFDHGGEAEKAGASYELNQALNEYSFSVIGRMNDLRLRTDPQVQQVLLKAWSAYVETLSEQKPEQARGREPDWCVAIAKSDSQELFLPYVEKALDDLKVPKTYGFLKAAAGVLAQVKAQRAIELLQQAGPLLPVGDAEEAADFFSSLTDLLAQEQRLPEAIKAQQEYVKQWGRGQAKLAMLYLQNKDDAAVDAVIKDLSTVDANEREINELANLLQGLETLAAGGG